MHRLFVALRPPQEIRHRCLAAMAGGPTGWAWQDEAQLHVTLRFIGEVERPLIEAMLARHGHNQLRAARALGINRNTLRKRLDTLGIDVGGRLDETA